MHNEMIRQEVNAPLQTARENVEAKKIMQKAIQDVIDTIIAAVPGAPREDSVDTIKTGDPTQEVTGIVTTFLATYDVIGRAIELGANLIITHDPTFYNHRDEIDWLDGDPVYEAKRRLIDENGMVIWRFHDYWHLHRPDGIITGLLKDLGWEDYAEPERPYLCSIPPMPLPELVASLKERLAISMVRVIGDPSMSCRNVGLAVGAAGGRTQIKALAHEGLDVLVCGEINEWETSEYVRDAVATGAAKALIIIGHANSEEAGMQWLVEWLQPLVPGMQITHVPAGDAFSFV